jgi:ABC-type multidrug transport system ATPase subunit
VDETDARWRLVIAVSDLTLRYPKTARPAVDSLTFEIHRAEIFGLLGPSGAGKSTTQKILIRVLKNYDGSVSVLGKNLVDWKSDYYERIGVSFEFPNHFLKLTGIENLAYFSRLYTGPTESPQKLLDRVLETRAPVLLSTGIVGLTLARWIYIASGTTNTSRAICARARRG